MQWEFIQQYSRLNNEKHVQISHSSSQTAAEKQVNERVTKLAEEALEMDEPEVLLDLRKLNGKPNSTAFDRFWESFQLTLRR